MSQIDETIVSAAIYPAIGIARVGNSRDEFFIGPEVTAPMKHQAGFYKDATGALKRQAARFRVYGLNAGGKVVKELTANNAQLTWRVHVANTKAAWYEFDVAMDIPQAKPVPLRNANFQGPLRQQLIIDPGPVEITGVNTSGTEYYFDKGKFIGEPVYLGELRTDEQGRLLFLGGHGISGTPFANNPPTTFANNNGWHDDVSDGPVDAEVIYEGRSLAVEGAWVVCAPPNYAPDIISVQTLYDVIVDALNNLYIPVKAQPSFMEDIYPLLQQLSSILSALYSRLSGEGKAVIGAFAGDRETILQYDISILRLYTQFLQDRQHYYGTEQRWPESLFWQTRREPSGDRYVSIPSVSSPPDQGLDACAGQEWWPREAHSRLVPSLRNHRMAIASADAVTRHGRLIQLESKARSFRRHQTPILQCRHVF